MTSSPKSLDAKHTINSSWKVCCVCDDAVAVATDAIADWILGLRDQDPVFSAFVDRCDSGLYSGL